LGRAEGIKKTGALVPKSGSCPPTVSKINCVGVVCDCTGKAGWGKMPKPTDGGGGGGGKSARRITPVYPNKNLPNIKTSNATPPNLMIRRPCTDISDKLMGAVLAIIVLMISDFY